jgi:hypothetical protein
MRRQHIADVASAANKRSRNHAILEISERADVRLLRTGLFSPPIRLFVFTFLTKPLCNAARTEEPARDTYTRDAPVRGSHPGESVWIILSSSSSTG